MQGFVPYILCLMFSVVRSSNDPSPVQCITPKGTCACETDQGLVDLSPLDNSASGKPRFEDEQDSTEFNSYSYNPCTPFTSSSDGCKNVMVCQKIDYGGVPSYYSLGDEDSQTWMTSPSGYLQISYAAAMPVGSSYFDLICDQTVDPGTLEALGSSGNEEYNFKLTSKYACPVSSSTGGLSAGSILLITATVLLITYLAVGIAFNVVKNGASGSDVIPNKDCWTALPGLAKDGCLFIINGIRSLCCRKGSEYNEL